MDAFVEDIYMESYEELTTNYHRVINELNQAKEQVKGWCESFNVRRTDPLPLPPLQEHRIGETAYATSITPCDENRIHVNAAGVFKCFLEPPQVEISLLTSNYQLYYENKVLAVEGNEYREDEVLIRTPYRDIHSSFFARDNKGQVMAFGHEHTQDGDDVFSIEYSEWIGSKRVAVLRHINASSEEKKRETMAFFVSHGMHGSKGVLFCFDNEWYQYIDERVIHCKSMKSTPAPWPRANLISVRRGKICVVTINGLVFIYSRVE